MKQPDPTLRRARAAVAWAFRWCLDRATRTPGAPTDHDVACVRLAAVSLVVAGKAARQLAR